MGDLHGSRNILDHLEALQSQGQHGGKLLEQHSFLNKIKLESTSGVFKFKQLDDKQLTELLFLSNKLLK